MLRVVYIIPLHKQDDRVFRAIRSIPESDEFVEPQVVVSCDEETYKWLEENNKNHFEFHCITEEDTSYPSLVNKGIEYVNDEIEDVDYISILEFDDTILKTAHKVVSDYSSVYTDAEILSPLACVVTEPDETIEDGEQKQTLIGMANEGSYAPQVAEKFGYIDFNMMLRNNFMFVNGLYIKPMVFDSVGTFKKNFKLFYDYEWALRTIYNGVVVRGVPKATHFHTASLDGAFEQQKAIPQKIREQWMSLAKKEYFFDGDRDIEIPNED